MSNKYSRRSIPSVSREDASASWLDDFIGNLEKESAKSQSQAQRSIYDDISAILGNTKPKFSNVEEAVKDLKQRTGLEEMLKIKASMENFKEPEIFKQIPEMKTFIDNYVAGRAGTSVFSVTQELMKLDSVRDKLPAGTDISPDVEAYINHKIGEALSHTPDHNQVNLDLGKVDHSVTDISDDPLSICEPFKS